MRPLASLAQAWWFWVLAVSETVARPQFATRGWAPRNWHPAPKRDTRRRAPGSGGHLVGFLAASPGPLGLLPGWQRRRKGRGAVRRGRARPGTRAPAPRPPPARPPAAALGTGIRASGAAGGAGGRASGHARLGAIARGRARRAPGAAWAARGPGRCSASGSCSQEGAPRGASGELRSLRAGKGCPPTPHPAPPQCSSSPGLGIGTPDTPAPNLRASPGLGKGPGSPPHCQPRWGQGPWASLAGRSSGAVQGSPASSIRSQQPPTAFSSPHHFNSGPQGRGKGHDGGNPKIPVLSAGPPPCT